MSTRGAIVRFTEGQSFQGVYHHWDSYPEGLGQTLVSLYKEQFDGDLDKMLATLIDDHPGGWSTINGKDWSLAPGFNEYPNKGDQPECYCHGDRSEESQVIDHTNASSSGCEFVYAFAEGRMYVLSSYHEDGSKAIGFFGCGDPDAQWFEIAKVALDNPGDWQSLLAD